MLSPMGLSGEPTSSLGTCCDGMGLHMGEFMCDSPMVLRSEQAVPGCAGLRQRAAGHDALRPSLLAWLGDGA